MKTWLKVLLILFVIGIAAGVLFYFFVINKPKPNYENKKPDYTLNAKDLYDAYKSNKTKSDSLYNGKTIEITGTLNKVETADSQRIAVFIFEQGDFGDQGVRCNMLIKYNTEISQIKTGSSIKLKGHCVGYDDTDVKFSECSVVK